MNTEGDFEVVIRADKKPANEHAGWYNAPTCNAVAVLMVGYKTSNRDIASHCHYDSLQRICETYKSYDPLQYPFLFPFMEDGYKYNIFLHSAKDSNVLTGGTVSIRQFHAHLCMTWEGNFKKSTPVTWTILPIHRRHVGKIRIRQTTLVLISSKRTSSWKVY